MDTEVRALARTLWEFHAAPARWEAPETADLILALGSHDVRVAVHAGRLWAAGAAPLVLISGGHGRRTSGKDGHARWQRCEAEVFAEVARDVAGVPDSALLLERHATHTGENFALSRTLAEEHGLKVGRAIVTAKPYMGRRALATAEVRWPDVDWVFRCFPGGYDGYLDEWHSERELIHFLVGDLQRLEVYAERGWNTRVEVPTAVTKAYERLVKLGFTDHAVPGVPLAQ
ncbi:YdcF family protein [Salinactinospora qingdaonensis]|uniref:YdcF family protein n=1 Tax=Salinactinospora qingdaonensis TaxID=702744 RepID=UPI0031EAEA56